MQREACFMMEYIILVHLCHEDSKSLWGESQGYDKLIKSNSFAERENKKISHQNMEENAIVTGETNRKS